MIYNFLKRKANEAQNVVTTQTVGTIETFEKVISSSEKVASSFASPMRKKVLQRFPVLFSILAAFGATATFLGLEQVILEYDIFQRHPLLLLSLGIIILVFTGKLYKKLD